MKRLILLTTCLLVLFSCKKEEPLFLVDKQASIETRNLYIQLKENLSKGIMFAHQDDLAYGHDWYGEPERSDVKEVTGDYPAMIGWEIGHIEIDAPYNLDSIYFKDMKNYIREGHKKGMLHTISWHGDNIVTGNTAWDCNQDTVVKTILPGGVNHEKYKVWLDRVAAFFADLKDENGIYIPVIFRMYHEHSGNWFWWGSQQCTAEEYKQLWRMTVEYLRDEKNIHHILYGYSPSETENEVDFLERYPGDEYVDIIGFDSYVPGKDRKAIHAYIEHIERNLKIITTYAAKSGKIPCLAETGMESVRDITYFTQVLYPLIAKHQLSYVLLWRNAWEKDKREHYYTPFPGHPASEDFKEFVSRKDILMLKDIQ